MSRLTVLPRSCAPFVPVVHVFCAGCACIRCDQLWLAGTAVASVETRVGTRADHVGAKATAAMARVAEPSPESWLRATRGESCGLVDHPVRCVRTVRGPIPALRANPG